MRYDHHPLMMNGVPLSFPDDEFPDDEYSDDEYSDDEYSDAEYSEAEHYDGGQYGPQPTDEPAPAEPTMADILVGFAQFSVLSVFLIAFMIVVTTSMAEMVSGAATDLPHEFASSFWLAVAFLMFLLYFLTREWQGVRDGEVVQFEAASRAGEKKAADIDIY